MRSPVEALATVAPHANPAYTWADLVVGHYQPMADGDALHIARTKAFSAVTSENTAKKTGRPVPFAVPSHKHQRQVSPPALVCLAAQGIFTLAARKTRALLT